MKWRATARFSQRCRVSTPAPLRLRSLSSALALLFMLSAALAQQDGLPLADDRLAVRVCMTCHGADWQGSEIVGGPALAGMEPWYLRRQLHNFRAGLRGSHADYVPAYEMRAAALLLSDADIDALADTFAALAPPTIRPGGGGDVERGRELYQVCTGCHGPRAEGNELLAAPALANRSDWYLLKQLRLFASGKRGAHPADASGAQMRNAAVLLGTDAERSAVLAYIGTLQ